MKIVIEIPEYVYERIKEYYDALPDGGKVDAKIVYIAEGIALPKGHGRLIDSTKLEDMIQEKGFNSPLINPVFGMMQVFEMIDDVPTIIEADKESVE